MSRPPKDRGSQLALDLTLDERTGLADFIRAGANASALDFVLSWPNWPHQAAVLAGPSGSGKSHLARIWAGLAGALIVDASDPGLAAHAAGDRNRFVVEDVGKTAFDEDALFHLFNRCAEPGGALLVTCSCPPARLDIALADLASRLRAATLSEILQPDEALIEAVLVKQLADRQIEVGPEITRFAVARMERSLAAARTLVGLIDRLSLEAGRRVTRPLVAQALEQMQAGDQT